MKFEVPKSSCKAIFFNSYTTLDGLACDPKGILKISLSMVCALVAYNEFLL